MLDIERRHQPDSGTGRVFAILDAYGEPTPDGKKLHISMHVSSEKSGVGSLHFKRTGETLWSSRIVPTTNATSTFAGNSLTIGTVSGLTTFAGAITGSGNGGVTKDGGSTQELSGANTYSGLTTVTSGVLVVSGSLSGTAGVVVSSLLATDAAASIGTASAGNVNLQAGGTLAPGGLAAAGTLTLNLGSGGKLDFASGSTLALNLGTSADRVSFLAVGDWLSGGGTGTTLALDITGPGFDYNNTYVVFENVNTPGFSFGEITGFDSVNVLAQFAQNGDRYELSFAAVPEPSSVALVAAAGLLGLAGYRGRRRGRV